MTENSWRLLTCMMFAVTMFGGCGSNSNANDGSTAIIDNPYETCYAGDICASGLTCAATTLPASSGYTGYFCTSGCNVDTDCVQVPANYAAACVNQQCYLTCPGGSYTCPYDQGCFTFDSNAGPIALCTP